MKLIFIANRFTKSLFVIICFFYGSILQAGVRNMLTDSRPNTPQEVIRGVVLDTLGSPLVGATVFVKESGVSARTDASGAFSLSATKGNTLVISFVGYFTKEATVTGSSVEVRLVQDAFSLEEAVVVGYGSQERSDVTGAVAQINAEDFRQGMNISPDNLMQGKVAGVRIVQSSGEPGAGVNVAIRGIGSIRSGSTPLFVIDGVPLSNENVSSAGPNLGLGSAAAKNPLNFLNTSDIESMTVLKDASAAAIYGARGSNGVVLITTKKGKQGEATLTYEPYVGFSSVIKKLDLVTAPEYRNAITDPTFDYGGTTDWQDELLRTAISQNHPVSFSKRTETGNYYVSLSHMDQEGIVETSDFRRTTARINAEESFFDNRRLKVKVNLTTSEIQETGIPNGSDAGPDNQLIIHALMANPTHAVFDENGNYTNFNQNAHYNPMYLLSVYSDHANTFRTLGNAEATFRIIPGLNYKFNYGLDRSVSERNTTIYPNLTDRTPLGAYVQSNLESLTTLLEHYLTYDFSFSKHNFNSLAGFSYQRYRFSGTYFGLTEIAAQGVGVAPEYNPNYSGEVYIPSPGYSQENELQSYFARVNYNYDSKYLVTASLRADGSTRFGDSNKYGYFPSVALGWALSKENFLTHMDAINELKLRASWGQTGNQEVVNKITQASFSLSPASGYYFNDDLALINGVVISRTANPNLRWEVVQQYNLGLDFNFWNSKLYGSLDYYNKTTNDPILNIPSEPLSPTPDIWTNVDAELINKGFELTLGSRLISRKDFTWSADINGATLDNVVRGLPVSQIYSGSISGPGLTGVTANIYSDGYEAGSFFLLEYTGLDAEGNYTYADINNDGVINAEDRQIFEGALPNLTFGLNSYMTYKDFDFSFSFIGQTGGYLMNNTALNLNINNLNSDRNSLSQYYESGANLGNVVQASTLYLEKSDFLRLNNVRVGYTFNLEQLAWIKSFNLYVSAQNLFTMTNYSGYDPLVDTNKAVAGNQSLGVDYTTYPSAKTVMVGAAIKF